MPAPRILIVYGTTYGQTAKIAERMAEHLMSWGHVVVLASADRVSHQITPDQFDGVIAGGSVIRGRHQRSILRFVRLHRESLNAMPSAFFSVSGSASSGTDAGRAEARGYLDEFLSQTGWHPELTATLAGAMAYTRYGPLTRWIIKRIAAKRGGPTDTSRDHEATDWAEVKRFARAVGAAVRERERVPV
ncbi:MAG TPA: flavodoxin domain-containing protein [Gemmatimonadaceae bacterium]